MSLNNAKNAFTTLKEKQDHNHLEFVLINKFKIVILRKPDKKALKKQATLGVAAVTIWLSSFSLIFIILPSIPIVLND